MTRHSPTCHPLSVQNGYGRGRPSFQIIRLKIARSVKWTNFDIKISEIDCSYDFIKLFKPESIYLSISIVERQNRLAITTMATQDRVNSDLDRFFFCQRFGRMPGRQWRAIVHIQGGRRRQDGVGGGDVLRKGLRGSWSARCLRQRRSNRRLDRDENFHCSSDNIRFL